MSDTTRLKTLIDGLGNLLLFFNRPNYLVKLDGNNKLPAVDGSQLTGITGGSGDVVGPASSVDNNIVLFDGITGKLLKDGGVYSPGLTQQQIEGLI